MKYEPKFYPDNAKLQSTFIMMSVTCDNGRLRYTTGVKMNPETFTKCQENDTYSMPFLQRKIELEKRVKDFVGSQWILMAPKKKVTVNELRDYLLTKDNKVAKAKGTHGTFFTYIDTVIKKIKDKTFKAPDGEYYSPNTVLGYGTIKKYIESMDKKLDLENVNIDTYYKFKIKMNEDGYAVQTMNTMIGRFKGLLQLGYEHGLHKNATHKNEDFKQIPCKKSESFALTNEEINDLYNLKLSGMDEKIRDSFIIQCFSGMRDSDMQNSAIERIDIDYKEEIVTVITQKKDRTISFPMSEEVVSILKKYNGSFPLRASTTHFNRRIKKICEQAGIDETVMYKRPGTDKVFKVPKWTLVATHTGRRSTVSRMLADNIDPYFISDITGQAISTIKRYDKRDSKDKAKQMKGKSIFAKKIA